LYEQERFEVPIAEAYTYAALEYAYVGNRELARKYAALAVERNLLWLGPRSKYVSGMAVLMEEPEVHASWRYIKKRGNATIDADGGDRLRRNSVM